VSCVLPKGRTSASEKVWKENRITVVALLSKYLALFTMKKSHEFSFIDLVKRGGGGF